jgi:SAM-dependent methyltransferase
MAWDSYHDSVGLKPNTSVLRLCEEHEGRRDAALDLGCGNLRDSLFLRKSGFKRVVAVDIEEPPELFEGIEFNRSRIEEFVPASGTFDIAVSCNALFYISKRDMPVVFARIYGSLANGGLFLGNVSGDKDEWVGKHGWVGHSEGEIRRLLTGYHAVLKRYQGKKAMANGTEKFSDTWMVRIAKK